MLKGQPHPPKKVLHNKFLWNLMENPIEVEIGLYTLSPPNIAHKWALKYHMGFTTLAHNSPEHLLSDIPRSEAVEES